MSLVDLRTPNLSLLGAGVETGHTCMQRDDEPPDDSVENQSRTLYGKPMETDFRVCKPTGSRRLPRAPRAMTADLNLRRGPKQPIRKPISIPVPVYI